MNASPAPTAIVADDERLMREQIIDRLKEAWPELVIVGEAGNGSEAIALVQSEEPDVAFLDISMPGMDGIQAAQALAGRAHVVFVTAHDQELGPGFLQAGNDLLAHQAFIVGNDGGGSGQGVHAGTGPIRRAVRLGGFRRAL